MKRIKLKKWVQVLLIIVVFVSVIILAGECEDDLTFYVSKIIGLIAFIGASELLYSYGG